MSRFKAGDLALVIQCRRLPENVGRCVELIQHLEAGELYFAPSNGDLRRAQAACWLVVGNVRGMVCRPDGTEYREVGHALFNEKRLMPLRGGFRSVGAGVRRVSE